MKKTKLIFLSFVILINFLMVNVCAKPSKIREDRIYQIGLAAAVSLIASYEFKEKHPKPANFFKKAGYLLLIVDSAMIINNIYANVK